MVRRHKAIWTLCLLMAFGLTITFSECALAKAPINTGDSGVTIKGYDTVAYFTKGKPVKGKDAFSLEWKGVKWLFTSKNHMELFAKNPEKYAPQYGGY
jgi:YHS domain-containing protein